MLRGLPCAVVFEDDARVADAWRAAFAAVDLASVARALVHRGCGMIVLGACWGKHASYLWPYRDFTIGGVRASLHLVPRHSKLETSRCAHAYLVTQEAAAKYAQVRVLDLPMDHFQNKWNTEAGVPVDWLEPPMFVQGHWKPHHQHPE